LQKQPHVVQHLYYPHPLNTAHHIGLPSYQIQTPPPTFVSSQTAPPSLQIQPSYTQPVMTFENPETIQNLLSKISDIFDKHNSEISEIFKNYKNERNESHVAMVKSLKVFTGENEEEEEEKTQEETAFTISVEEEELTTEENTVFIASDEKPTALLEEPQMLVISSDFFSMTESNHQTVEEENKEENEKKPPPTQFPSTLPPLKPPDPPPSVFTAQSLPLTPRPPPRPPDLHFQPQTVFSPLRAPPLTQKPPDLNPIAESHAVSSYHRLCFFDAHVVVFDPGGTLPISVIFSVCGCDQIEIFFASFTVQCSYQLMVVQKKFQLYHLLLRTDTCTILRGGTHVLNFDWRKGMSHSSLMEMIVCFYCKVFMMREMGQKSCMLRASVQHNPHTSVGLTPYSADP
jgi:hypothetical protein